jgi:hypothetical protein
MKGTNGNSDARAPGKAGKPLESTLQGAFNQSGAVRQGIMARLSHFATLFTSN